MQNEQVARRRGDEHLGAVGRQTHPHQVASVEELLVRAAVLREPAWRRGDVSTTHPHPVGVYTDQRF